MNIENCDPIKVLNNFADNILSENAYIYLNPGNSKNALEQICFAEKDKFHFLEAIKRRYVHSAHCCSWFDYFNRTRKNYRKNHQ